MDKTRRIENLALIGFMGTGKSSVGQLVADLMNFAFVDTDALIEEQSGHAIGDLFAAQGEPAFRAWEAKIVGDLSKLNRTVIATGGGLPINPANFNSLKSHSLLVCLWLSPEKIWERVRDQSHRPLLKETDPEAKIRSLLAERAPIYRQADVLINSGLRSLREVAVQVVHQFHMAKSGRP